jgi:hypothetical protein
LKTAKGHFEIKQPLIQKILQNSHPPRLHIKLSEAMKLYKASEEAYNRGR